MIGALTSLAPEAGSALTGSTLGGSALAGWLALGVQQCEVANWTAALAAFAQALTLDGNSVAARCGQAIALNGLGWYAEAILTLEMALARSPELPELWTHYGTALAGMGRPEEALAAFGQALARQGDQPHLWHDCARVFISLDRYSEAVAACDRALGAAVGFEAEAEEPGELTESLTLAVAERNQLWQQLTHQSPHHYSDIAPATQASPPAEGALAGWPELAFDPPADAVAIAAIWLTRGLALKKLDRTEQALESFERAAALNPDSSEIWNQCGIILDALGQPAAAAAAYDRALILDEANPSLWNNLGIVLEAQGRHGDALAAFHRSLSLASDDPDVWNNCGLALEGLAWGDSSRSEGIRSAELPELSPPPSYDPHLAREAIAAYERAITLTGGRYWKAAANAGWAVLRLRGYRAALEVWNSGLALLRLKPGDRHLGAAVLHYHKGRALDQQAQRCPDPHPHWQAALDSFSAALEVLDAEAETDWYLEIVRWVIATHRNLGQTEAADAWIRTGSDLLRRLVRETDSTARKIDLAAQLASFGRH